jgi:hypothetical protein
LRQKISSGAVRNCEAITASWFMPGLSKHRKPIAQPLRAGA